MSNVHAKLRAVMQAVAYVAKDATMMGYEYLTEDKLTGALHTAFADAGLTFAPIRMEIVGVRESETKSGTAMHTARILTTFRLTDCDEPESYIEVVALGEGADTGDKCLNKAMTAAYKYALLETCMISTGDDPDKSASAETTPTKRQAPTPPQRSTPVTASPAPPADSVIVGQCPQCGRHFTAAQQRWVDTYTGGLCKRCAENEARQEQAYADETPMGEQLAGE